MNRSQAQYLRIFDNAATYQRFQSYYVNQTITLSSASWSYHPFMASGAIDGSSSSNDVTIEIPATQTAVSAFTAALNLNRLCQVLMYEFDSRLGQVSPSGTQVLIGSFLGEVVKITGVFTNLTITVGSSLAPVGAQVPPRKFTSYLVGSPLNI